MFFVEEGTIEITWEDVRIPKNKRIGHRVTRVEDAQSFGEEGLMSDDNQCPPHVFSAVAVRQSTLFYINRGALIKLLYHHPRVKARCQMLITQKLNRWQARAQQTLKDHIDALATTTGGQETEFGKPMHEYEPKGTLSVPIFSECGQVVDTAKEPGTQPELGNAAAQSDAVVPQGGQPAESEQDSVASLRADVRRLEAKLDKALDVLMQ